MVTEHLVMPRPPYVHRVMLMDPVHRVMLMDSIGESLLGYNNFFRNNAFVKCLLSIWTPLNTSTNASFNSENLEMFDI